MLAEHIHGRLINLGEKYKSIAWQLLGLPLWSRSAPLILLSIPDISMLLHIPSILFHVRCPVLGAANARSPMAERICSSAVDAARVAHTARVPPAQERNHARFQS